MKEVMSEETREMLKRSLQSILDRNDGDINPGNSDYYDEVSRALEQLKKEDEKQNEAEVQSTVEDPYSSPEQ